MGTGIVKNAWLVVSLAFGLFLLGTPDADAGGIYMWRAPDGTVHFSDRPKDERWETLKGDDQPTEAVEGILDHARLNAHIKRLSRHYNIDENLIRAIIKVESNFDPLAVSRKGAMGLMQLMPATANFVGVADAYDPYQNVTGGVKYLRYLVQRMGGHMVHVLAAYNAGPGAVESYGSVPPYRETQLYVRRVLQYYRAYRSQSEGAQRASAGVVVASTLPESSS